MLRRVILHIANLEPSLVPSSLLFLRANLSSVSTSEPSAVPSSPPILRAKSSPMPASHTFLRENFHGVVLPLCPYKQVPTHTSSCKQTFIGTVSPVPTRKFSPVSSLLFSHEQFLTADILSPHLQGDSYWCHQFSLRTSEASPLTPSPHSHKQILTGVVLLSLP